METQRYEGLPSSDNAWSALSSGEELSNEQLYVVGLDLEESGKGSSVGVGDFLKSFLPGFIRPKSTSGQTIKRAKKFIAKQNMNFALKKLGISKKQYKQMVTDGQISSKQHFETSATGKAFMKIREMPTRSGRKFKATAGSASSTTDIAATALEPKMSKAARSEEKKLYKELKKLKKRHGKDFAKLGIEVFRGIVRQHGDDYASSDDYKKFNDALLKIQVGAKDLKKPAGEESWTFDDIMESFGTDEGGYGYDLDDLTMFAGMVDDEIRLRQLPPGVREEHVQALGQFREDLAKFGEDVSSKCAQLLSEIMDQHGAGYRESQEFADLSVAMTGLFEANRNCVDDDLTTQQDANALLAGVMKERGEVFDIATINAMAEKLNEYGLD